MRHLTYTILSLLLAGQAAAQSAAPPADQLKTVVSDGAPKGNAKITGYAIDSTMTKAVEFANVALYETTSGKLVDGAVADEKGKFSLTKLTPGTYKLLISFLGYAARSVDNIVLSKGQTKDIGVIRLIASTRTLGEVTVAGKKALVEDKVDRLIYNADNDVAAKGGDAIDILSTDAFGRSDR
ncbi:carboxypeptidase regulatory-like domain-containing protein [Spirosoma pulveris]